MNICGNFRGTLVIMKELRGAMANPSTPLPMGIFFFARHCQWVRILRPVFRLLAGFIQGEVGMDMVQGLFDGHSSKGYVRT